MTDHWKPLTMNDSVIALGIKANNAHREDVSCLLKNVQEIAWAGNVAPGSLTVVNDYLAFPLVTAASAQEDRSEVSVVAACKVDSGKVVAFGHDGFLGLDEMWEYGDNVQLHKNIIKWMAGEASPRLGILGIPGLAKKLTDLGYNAKDIALNESSGYNVLYFHQQCLSDGEVEQLRWFVKGGGGVVTAATGWGWQESNPEKSLIEDFPGNKFLAPLGVMWTKTVSSKSSMHGFVVHPRAVMDQKAAWIGLMGGVSELVCGGEVRSGSFVVVSSTAFPLVVARATKTSYEPVMVASCNDDCKIVAFGHDSFLTTPATWRDNLCINLNIINWMTKPNPKPKIGVLDQNQKSRMIVDNLLSAGLDPYLIEVQQDCSGYDMVYCIYDWNDSQLKRMSDYLDKGGSVVVAASGSEWSKENLKYDLRNDFPGNKLLSRYGIVWTKNEPEKTCPSGYLVKGIPSPGTNAYMAWRSYLSHRDRVVTLSAEKLTQVAHTLTVAICASPSSKCCFSETSSHELTKSCFLPLIEEMVHASEMVVPSDKSPVTDSNLLGRLGITFQFRKMQDCQQERQIAHPASAYFPRNVSTVNECFNKEIVIDTTQSRWHCIGVYAPPGEVITLTVPKNVAKNDFKLRIGSHSDRLWHLEEWHRFPEICFEYDIDEVTTVAANPFGGLVYIDVPEGTDVELFVGEVSGGVESIQFKLDDTSENFWKEQIRQHNQSPFGEIGSGKCILTLPRSSLSQVTHPEELCEFWDAVLDAMADLVGCPHKRSYAERIVFDIQLSYGYMHAGYPLMCPLSKSLTAIDMSSLKTKGDWGLFHELGHNHQSVDWTFEGSEEVTANLFALYVFETVIGIPVEKNPRGDVKFRRQQMASYNFNKPDLAKWKSDPFLGLVMYVQLQQAFGWDTYKSVFAEYRRLSELEKPKTNQEKIDQWLIRFSNQAHFNLEPFFYAWGISASSECIRRVNHLPDWYCPDFEYLQPDERPIYR